MVVESYVQQVTYDLHRRPADMSAILLINMCMSTFAERIKLALNEEGMTAYGLSKEMGWTANYVSRLLKSKAAQGAHTNLRGGNLFRMARILKVREAWLGYEKGPMREEDEKKGWEAQRTTFDKAVDYWRGHVSDSALVAAEAWATRYDPPDMSTLAWGQLFQEAQRQLTEGREPVLPPPRPPVAQQAAEPSRGILAPGDTDPPARDGTG